MAGSEKSAKEPAKKPSFKVFAAISLDGFLARSDGSLDWLDKANAGVPSGEDCGFGQFMESVDLLLMGRHTFEQVMGFGKWPYGKTPVVVLSSRPLGIPESLSATVSHLNENPQALAERFLKAGISSVYVDGGITIQKFLQAGLVHEMTLTVIPVLLGEGKSMFCKLPQDVLLQHVETISYDFGFVQVKYKVLYS